MNFEEWKKWKESQTIPTCDHVGCLNSHPVWELPQNHIFFCVEHGAELGGVDGMARMYGESPVYKG